MSGVVTVLARRVRCIDGAGMMAVGVSGRPGMTPCSRSRRWPGRLPPRRRIILVEECRLRLDEPVDRLVPNCLAAGPSDGWASPSMTRYASAGAVITASRWFGPVAIVVAIAVVTVRHIMGLNRAAAGRRAAAGAELAEGGAASRRPRGAARGRGDHEPARWRKPTFGHVRR